MEVSVLGFGASPLGNVFGDVPSGDDARTVRAAVDAGISLFDVSPYYGLGLAEQRLGAALEGVRDQVILATKCGRYGVDRFNFSSSFVTHEFEASLRRLRTDHVDILQVHDIEFGNIDQILTETLPALAALKQQGKTRLIGITGYWPGLLARVAAAFPVDTVLNYCHANLFINDMDRALSPAATEGRSGPFGLFGLIGLINASPLHMGLLGDGPVPDWHPAPPALRDVATKIRQLCREHNVQPATVALYICLQHPVVASTLVGIASAGQVAQNCAALSWQPDHDLLRAIDVLVQPVFNTVWPQGRPENADISHDIPAVTTSAGDPA